MLGSSAPRPARPSMPPGYGIHPASAGGMLPWETVTHWLLEARNYWVCTSGPDGRPHAMPVWGLWLNEAFWFSSDPDSRKARNLAANSDIVVHLESGDNVVILEGEVLRIAGADALRPFADAYFAKYGVEIDLSNPDFGVYVLKPVKALAWREQDFPSSATRWRLGPSP